MLNSINPPPNASEIKSQLLRSPADIPIVHTWYEIYTQFHERLGKFPKSQRYTLGQTCNTYLLTFLEHTLAAASTSNITSKKELLREASVKLDTLRLLLRLAKDCACLSNNAYLALESKLHEIGRMLGAWIKSLGKANPPQQETGLR